MSEKRIGYPPEVKLGYLHNSLSQQITKLSPNAQLVILNVTGSNSIGKFLRDTGIFPKKARTAGTIALKVTDDNRVIGSISFNFMDLATLPNASTPFLALQLRKPTREIINAPIKGGTSTEATLSASSPHTDNNELRRKLDDRLKDLSERVRTSLTPEKEIELWEKLDAQLKVGNAALYDHRYYSLPDM